MLKKYTPDPSHVLPYAKIPLQSNMTYEESPAKILSREIRLFNHKETPMPKVRWEKHTNEEATWELESEMYDKYPYLFWCNPYDCMYSKFQGWNFLRGKDCKNPYFKKVEMVIIFGVVLKFVKILLQKWNNFWLKWLRFETLRVKV